MLSEHNMERFQHVTFQWDDDDEVHFVPDQHAYQYFNSASSVKQQSADRHVALQGRIILIQAQLVHLFFLMLQA